MYRRNIRGAAVLSAATITLIAFALSVHGYGGSGRGSALFNHPVLVEGNCDSPVPGTTIVQQGTCGDFDGDGRIGTAEDTDGADRIFGTLNGAIGPGTGAAAGTGANYNGRILIVKSGRFSEMETRFTGGAPGDPANGLALFAPDNPSPGHIQIEAAPGVDATIDAVFQGDPAGGNNRRQGGAGIVINMPSGSRILFRNLTLRNWATGIDIQEGFVTIENCRVDNNLNYGIRVRGEGRVVIYNSSINGNGYRVGTAGGTATPGMGISFEGLSAGSVVKTLITGNRSAALSNTSAYGASAVHYYEVFGGFNGGGIVNATQDSSAAEAAAAAFPPIVDTSRRQIRRN